VAVQRYEQFCPLARAAEILGERWTLLILRELQCGPQRFSDLRRRLPGISTSVLAGRLATLEERGLLGRTESPPPAPAALYALTETGAASAPVLREMMRFGIRFLDGMQPGDHLEPGWLRLALEAFARRTPTPSRSLELNIRNGAGAVRVAVEGGPDGTTIRDPEGDADVCLNVDPLVLLGLATGQLEPLAALSAGAFEASGDTTALLDLPALFDLDTFVARPPDGSS
jgi:DNA-binding HxlR family transcriptional regulator